MKMISWQTRALTGCIFLPVESCRPMRSTGFKIIYSFPPCWSLEILSPLFPSLLHPSLLYRLPFSPSPPHFCSRSRVRVHFYAALLRHLVAARSARGRGEKKPSSSNHSSRDVCKCENYRGLVGINDRWCDLELATSAAIWHWQRARNFKYRSPRVWLNISSILQILRYLIVKSGVLANLWVSSHTLFVHVMCKIMNCFKSYKEIAKNTIWNSYNYRSEDNKSLK